MLGFARQHADRGRRLAESAGGVCGRRAGLRTSARFREEPRAIIGKGSGGEMAAL